MSDQTVLREFSETSASRHHVTKGASTPNDPQVNAPQSDSNPHRIVYVGCGSAKNYDIDSCPAATLYTSNYFKLKREYAERMGDSWYIISAKYGVIHPWKSIEPYDITISDYPLDEADAPLYRTLDHWASAVTNDIIADIETLDTHPSRLLPNEIVFLAGKDYLDPIRNTLEREFSGQDIDLKFPFDQTSGIGEQMGWLKDATDTSRGVSDIYASAFD